MWLRRSRDTAFAVPTVQSQTLPLEIPTGRRCQSRNWVVGWLVAFGTHVARMRE